MNAKVPGEEQRLSLKLLGPPEASIGGRPLRFGTKKTFALLCYLAAEGRKYSRRELAELLWPESDRQHARTGLRSALARLKKTLGEKGALGQEVAGFLVVEGDLLGLEPQGPGLDLKAFEAALSLARTETSSLAGRSTDAVGCRELIDRLREDLGLYRGEFMEGFSLDDAPEYELWVEVERGRWRRVFGELCERLTRLQSEASQLDEAIETARVWVRHAPLEEGAHRRLMELLSSAGESGEALLAYEDYLGASSSGLNVEPSARMQELAHRLQAEVQERASLDASPARSGDIPTSPLSELDVPLVGRHEEFGALVSEYHAASGTDRGGQTHVVALLGEAGIGKTRLAEEFLLWAKSRGAKVLEGGATEGGGLPYGPLVEAIRPRIESERAPDDLLEDVWLSELSRLLPELKERYPDLPPPTSGEAQTAKGGLFEAVARMVEALAINAPVVLFLDDLHWADAATLDVLDYAGKRWTERGATVLLLIAARPEEAEAGFAFERWLSSLGRRLPVRNLKLDPLGNEDVEVLLRRLVRAGSSRTAGALEGVGGSNAAESGLEGLGERLALESEGQPFYVVEMLKALLEDGKLLIRRRGDGGGIMEVEPSLRVGSDVRGLLPRSVREVIRSRLSSLSPAASELLRAGAVLERAFGVETLVCVAGLGEAEGLKELDELTERHLLREETGVREGETLLYPRPDYSFTHEKIRQVVYTEMGHPRRRLLHRRAVEVLEESGAPAAQLARHALAGSLAEPAYNYSVAAGDQAMEVFAARDAIEHYERARKLLTEEGGRTGARQLVVPSIADIERLYAHLGQAYEIADELGKARAAYEAMRARGRKVGEARLEVAALNHLAILTFHQADPDSPKAKALLEEARKVAGEASLKEALVETECNLADVMAYQAGEFEHSGPLARKALASARVLEEERPDLIARALWTLARLELLRGRLDESAAYAQEGAALSRESAQRRPPRVLLPSMLAAGIGLEASWRAGTKAMEIQCLNLLAYDRIMKGHLTEGIKSAREALSGSRELLEGAEARSSAVVGLGLVEIGEYEEARELCLRGTKLARTTQNVFLLWLNLDVLGVAYEALLDLEEARGAHEEALSLREPLAPQYQAYSSIRLCAVAVLSEDLEEAYAHAKRAHKGRTSLDVLQGFYLHYMVEALLRGGDERGAREEIHRFAERAEVNERYRIAYLRSLAVLSEWEGDTPGAIEHLHEARALAEKIGLPGEMWQIQVRLGELHERRGEIEEAQEAFSRAERTLRTLAGKIRDEKLREAFLSAWWVRRVLGHTN